MKREHFDILWEQSDTGCLGPPFQPVPKKIWQDLVKKRIISDISIPDVVLPFDPDNEYGDIGMRCFYEDDINSWAISGFSSEELERLHSEGKIRICHIETEALARLTAEQWGLKPVYWEPDLRTILTGTYVIGWKDRDTAVVVTDFGGKSGSLAEFLWTIKETITDGIPEVVEEGFFDELDEENQDETDQPSSWTCKKLYVISIGSSYGRTTEQEKELASLDIICLGTQDFLSDDGRPRWDVSKPLAVPRKIVYSDGFSQIRWRGNQYSLSRLQAKAISVLYDNYEDEVPQVHQKRILDRIGSKSKRLEHLFKNSPLWGTLIVPGDRKGLFQLKI